MGRYHSCAILSSQSYLDVPKVSITKIVTMMWREIVYTNFNIAALTSIYYVTNCLSLVFRPPSAQASIVFNPVMDFLRFLNRWCQEAIVKR